MTAHASKGLGYDNVIIINCINGTFGFPSKIQNDPVMKHVLIEDKTYDFAEERRLFYVAMTRTKNRVFFTVPEKMPSEFLIEINKEYEKIVKHGEWQEEIVSKSYKKMCPMCGYPMQFKYKPAYGLRLNICTNDPELCGFMTNDLKAGKMQIMKCDQCQDGYLIVKPWKDTYVLGCTNYKKDGTGCNNFITREKYYEMQSLTPDKPIESKVKIKDSRASDMSLNISGDKIEAKTYNIYNSKSFDDFYEVTRIIISCVEVVSQKKYLGSTKIIDLLFGKEISTYKSKEFSKINEFGVLQSCNRKDIEILVYAMEKAGLLLKTKEKYPVLHPTNEGKDYIENPAKERVRKLYKAFFKISQNFNKKSDDLAKTSQK